MDISEILKRRRAELGLSQSDLARAAGVDQRQIRRYEFGEQQPLLSVAVSIAEALKISLSELVGSPTPAVSLTGTWWTSWQTFKDGQELVAVQEVRIRQDGDFLQVETLGRGRTVENGGYHWRGELRLWDNEILMGWYAATEGSVRSKGTMYFVLHPHGQQATGRWVGLSYDGKIVTGRSGMAHDADQARALAAADHSGTDTTDGQS